MCASCLSLLISVKLKCLVNRSCAVQVGSHSILGTEDLKLSDFPVRMHSLKLKKGEEVGTGCQAKSVSTARPEMKQNSLSQ